MANVEHESVVAKERQKLKEDLKLFSDNVDTRNMSKDDQRMLQAHLWRYKVISRALDRIQRKNLSPDVAQDRIHAAHLESYCNITPVLWKIDFSKNSKLSQLLNRFCDRMLKSL